MAFQIGDYKMTIKLSLKGGGGGMPMLAPSTPLANGVYTQVEGINATGGLTEVLSLTGKFELTLITFGSMSSLDMIKLKLTIDSVDIWNEDPYSPPPGTTIGLIGGNNATTSRFGESFLVNESLSLSIEMNSDTDIDLFYAARPIL